MKALLESKRIHFVTGKGGVGKSRVATILAYMAAALGRKVLIVDLDANGSITKFFGTKLSEAKKLGFKPRKLAPNIDGAFIRPVESLKEYATRQLKFKKISDLMFDNKIMSFFLDATPGIEEIALMGKIFYFDEEKTKKKPKWDTIIIDAPATGHGLYLFRSPKIFIDITRVGPLAVQTKKILDMMTDPDRSVIHLVSLAEELPIQETIELYGALKKDGLPVGHVILNKMLPIPNELHDTKMETDELSTELKKKINKVIAKFTTRHNIQASYRNKIQGTLSTTCLEVPWILDPKKKIEAIAKDVAKTWI